MVVFFIRFVDILTQVLSYAILIRAILSWFPNVPRDNPFVEVLYQITEPVLGPIRRLLPSMGGIDFSPLVAFFVLKLLSDAVAMLTF